MERRGAAGDTEDTADLPSGFALGGPFEAFELARRQRDTVNDAVSGEFAAGMHVEVHRHELEHLGVCLDAAAERRMVGIGGEGDGGDRAAAVMDGDGEPATDVEGRGLVEEALLPFRQCSRPTLEYRKSVV